MAKRLLKLNRDWDGEDTPKGDEYHNPGTILLEQEIRAILESSFESSEYAEARKADESVAAFNAEMDHRYMRKDNDGNSVSYAHISPAEHRDEIEARPVTDGALRASAFKLDYNPEVFRVNGKPITLIAKGEKESASEARFQSTAAVVTKGSLEFQANIIKHREMELDVLLDAAPFETDELSLKFCNKSGAYLGKHDPRSIAMLVQVHGRNEARRILSVQQHSHCAPHWFRTDRDSLERLQHSDPHGLFVFLAKQIAGDLNEMRDSDFTCTSCKKKYSTSKRVGHILSSAQLGKLRLELANLPSSVAAKITRANSQMIELCYMGIHREEKWPKKLDKFLPFHGTFDTIMLDVWNEMMLATVEHFVKGIVKDKEVDRKAVITTNRIANFIMGNADGTSKRGRERYKIFGEQRMMDQSIAVTLDRILAPYESEDPFIQEQRFAVTRPGAIPKKGFRGTSHALETGASFELKSKTVTPDVLKKQGPELPTTGFKLNSEDDS